MSERRSGSATPGGQTLVLAIVAIVAFAGIGAFAVGGSSAALVGEPADRSPYPGKEVTPDNTTTNETVCPPAEDETDDTTIENDTADGTDASGYQLRIDYEGEWRGTIVTENSDIPIEGSGNETIDIEADEDERIAASVAKTDISSEPLAIRLLLNGEVIDGQNPAEPDVDNFDRTGESTIEETSTESTFGSTSDTTGNESGDDGWETFGEENESTFEDSSGNSFDDQPVTASDDPFGDDETNETVTALDSDAGTTNDTDTTVAEECGPVEATAPTNDTDTTAETTNDTAFSTASESAQVVFADQTVAEGGTNVTVESATLPDGGFVVIHNESLMEGNVRGSMIGVSERLDAETNEDVEVDLARRVEESQQLFAVLYRDSDGDGEFEYGETAGTSDEPYLDANGTAVFDDAMITVPGTDSTDATAGTSDTSAFGNGSDAASTTSTEEESVFADTATPVPIDNESAAGSETGTAPAVSATTVMSGNAEEATRTNAPGFGMGVAIVALLGAALLATRRR